MAIIRAIPLTATAVKVIPPDGLAHTGPTNWTLVATAAAVLLDAPTGGNQFPLAAGVMLQTSETVDEEIWATGTGTMNVIGFEANG
jgi:hypothetical protein